MKRKGGKDVKGRNEKGRDEDRQKWKGIKNGEVSRRNKKDLINFS